MGVASLPNLEMVVCHASVDSFTSINTVPALRAALGKKLGEIIWSGVKVFPSRVESLRARGSVKGELGELGERLEGVRPQVHLRLASSYFSSITPHRSSSALSASRSAVNEDSLSGEKKWIAVGLAAYNSLNVQRRKGYSHSGGKKGRAFEPWRQTRFAVQHSFTRKRVEFGINKGNTAVGCNPLATSSGEQREVEPCSHALHDSICMNTSFIELEHVVVQGLRRPLWFTSNGKLKRTLGAFNSSVITIGASYRGEQYSRCMAERLEQGWKRAGRGEKKGFHSPVPAKFHLWAAHEYQKRIENDSRLESVKGYEEVQMHLGAVHCGVVSRAGVRGVKRTHDCDLVHCEWQLEILRNETAVPKWRVAECPESELGGGRGRKVLGHDRVPIRITKRGHGLVVPSPPQTYITPPSYPSN
ncbi:1533_t:CDS:2, partial [Acaulospora colombiana]